MTQHLQNKLQAVLVVEGNNKVIKIALPIASISKSQRVMMGGNMPILHSGDSDTKTMKQNSRVLSSSMYLSTMLSINVGILASRLVLASSSLADDVSDDVVVGGVVVVRFSQRSFNDCRATTTVSVSFQVCCCK